MGGQARGSHALSVVFVAFFVILAGSASHFMDFCDSVFSQSYGLISKLQDLSHVAGLFLVQWLHLAWGAKRIFLICIGFGFHLASVDATRCCSSHSGVSSCAFDSPR